MFTRLYYKSLCSVYYKETLNGISITNNKGTTITANAFYEYSASGRIQQGLRSFCTKSKGESFSECIAFGNGDTPVTMADYQLSGNHLTTYSGSYTCVINADCDEVTWTYTLTNSGSDDFTIKEVGLFTNTGSSSTTALVLREVLTEPVTIAANGGVGQVTLTLKITPPES